MFRNLAILAIVVLQALSVYSNYSEPVEYHPYDGWFNNLAHPSWGAIDQPLLRKLPVAYADGVYRPSGQNRPNPFKISDAIMAGPAGLGSYQNRSALLVFFGQQVVEEILDAQRGGCPREYFNIKVPTDHRYNPEHKDDLEMPLLRSRYDMANSGKSPNSPRQQLNEITPYMDGGLVYGAAKGWADALRAFRGGLLAVDESNGPWDGKDVRGTFPQRNDVRLPMANPPPPRDHYLKNVDRFFKLGNPRGNENPMLLTFGILLFRYHNWWALELNRQHPTWSDERLYNEARKMVIGVYQKIVMYDWLPVWLGSDVGSYPGYDPSVDPQIANVFQSAAMRFGHTLVTPGVYRRRPGSNCSFEYGTFNTHESGRHAVRTCNAYWNPQEAVEEFDIDGMLLGMASQLCEREDQFIVPDLREAVFGPLEWSRRDLMAINIQRARDHGLPDYNTARLYYGLNKVQNFSEINPNLYKENSSRFDGIMRVYNNNLDDIDIWAGGILETTPEGPGPLFRAIILDQFKRIRQGDRLWYENYKINGMYNNEEISIINRTTLYDIVLNVTNIQPSDVQQDLFHVTDAPCILDQLSAENRTQLIECEQLHHFDYFKGSVVSYVLTFLAVGLFIVGMVLLMLFLARRRDRARVQKRSELHRRRTEKQVSKGAKNQKYVAAYEWVDKNKDHRAVRICLNQEQRLLQVLPQKGSRPLRTIDMKMVSTDQPMSVQLATDHGSKIMLIHVPKEYDLVLKFDNMAERDEFVEQFGTFVEHIGHNQVTRPTRVILNDAMTYSKRQELLAKFFRAVFRHAFEGSKDVSREDDVTESEAAEILSCELTKFEFAEALGMQESSIFVDKMFELVDKRSKGYISFREFLDIIIIFHTGSPKKKVRLLFDMYDLDHNGSMSKKEFQEMIKSLMELSSSSVQTSENIEKLVNEMFQRGKFGQSLTFEDFSRIMEQYDSILQYSQLHVKGNQPPPPTAQDGAQNAPLRAHQTIVRALSHEGDQANRRLSVLDAAPVVQELPQNVSQTEQRSQSKKLLALQKWFENYYLHLFWATMYTIVTILIFCERAYYYSVEREHVGLRRHAGYGVTVTRGAASVMMFTYASLLLTMSRNVITYLRETFLHRYIPFDAAVDFHKYIAYLALIGTLVHVIGHSLNFYHIASQTADDLSCIFRDFHHATHVLPKFHYWCWGTITGLTGVFVTLVIIVIFIFATKYARQHVFNWFWFTHSLYIVMYILMFLHGMGRLVQAPLFQNFFIAPAVVFVIDRLISISRKKVEIPVMKAEHLPSEVTFLKFARPSNFQYLSGQWVRIAAKGLGGREYHPFTLTSAPHEDHLSLHIRAVGPWTINLRRLFDPDNIGDHKFPKIYLDGPFGEGHQDWYKFEVSVLVGGGIGVTPFASILKDIAFKSQFAQKIGCKKVYFLWVTRTQKQFEWLTDIIKQVEEKDQNNLVAVHIFITQLHQKFDMRSTMLYICERHFQKIAGRSLFTGLRSITHFGRPNFVEVLRALEGGHPGVRRIGVFSCGPPPMTKDLDKACQTLNAGEGALYQHHFENF